MQRREDYSVVRKVRRWTQKEEQEGESRVRGKEKKKMEEEEERKDERRGKRRGDRSKRNGDEGCGEEKKERRSKDQDEILCRRLVTNPDVHYPYGNQNKYHKDCWDLVVEKSAFFVEWSF